MYDHFHIFNQAKLKFGISSYCGQETILHSVRCARQRELVATRDVEDVISVIGGG